MVCQTDGTYKPTWLQNVKTSFGRAIKMKAGRK
jgi:hypothetical protein